MFSCGTVQHGITQLARTDLRETNAHDGEPVLHQKKTENTRKVQPRVIVSNTHATHRMKKMMDSRLRHVRAIKTHSTCSSYNTGLTAF
jgi:hypothetical protein